MMSSIKHLTDKMFQHENTDNCYLLFGEFSAYFLIKMCYMFREFFTIFMLKHLHI
jgi:hypothetical protein